MGAEEYEDTYCTLDSFLLLVRLSSPPAPRHGGPMCVTNVGERRCVEGGLVCLNLASLGWLVGGDPIEWEHESTFLRNDVVVCVDQHVGSERTHYSRQSARIGHFA